MPSSTTSDYLQQGIMQFLLGFGSGAGYYDVSSRTRNHAICGSSYRSG